MRLNYYLFPDGVDANTRARNGAEAFENTCTADAERWASLDNPYIDCPYKAGNYGCLECSKLVCIDADDMVSGISVTRAKQLISEFGGRAWTRHIDRDGGVFEISDIRLKGNNSRFKYNRHL